MTNTHARKAALAHVAGLVFNRPVAVTAERAQTILNVIGTRLLDGVVVEGEDPKITARTIDRRAALADVEITAEGIAIIPVVGTFVKRATMMDAMSGLASYDQVSAKVRAAADAEQVRGIMLVFDTPGGEVHGLFEAVGAIKAAREKKRIWGHSDEMAYSAGYAMASACERLWVPVTGGVGSIGVIAARLDVTEADAAAGVRWTIVSAGAQKAYGHPNTPTSEAEIDALTQKVEQVNDLFVASVAENRGMSGDAVRALQAATYLGQAGIDAGLADDLGMLDDALAAFAVELSKNDAVPSAATDGAQASTGAEVIDLTTAREEGAVKARREERDRANAINAACVKAGERGLAGGYIAEGLSLSECAARLEVVAGIRDACATAKHPDLAAGFIARSMSVEQVATELLANAAAADEAKIVHSQLSPDAIGGDAPATKPSVTQIYRNYQARMQGRKGAEIQ